MVSLLAPRPAKFVLLRLASGPHDALHLKESKFTNNTTSNIKTPPQGFATGADKAVTTNKKSTNHENDTSPYLSFNG